MITTPRSTADIRPLIVAATASLVALVTLCVFVANVVTTTSETNARISERVAAGEVVSAGHVLVNATSAPDGSAAPVTTTSETTRETPAERTTPVGKVAPACQEDNACWNSCTMGNFGPCDMGAVLPYGGQFAVTVTTNTFMTCDQVNGVRYVAVDVTVSVVSPDGVARHDGVTRTACVLAVAPFAGGSPVELAPMFREVASQL